jgi:hypothetical protein
MNGTGAIICAAPILVEIEIITLKAGQFDMTKGHRSLDEPSSIDSSC